MPDTNPTPAQVEVLAQAFHETYERLAPAHGYRTREASAKPWADVPEQNKALMIAVCAEILETSGRAVLEAQLSMLEWAWAIMANAGEGNWEHESKDWQEAAARWRDQYNMIISNPNPVPLEGSAQKSIYKERW